MIYSEQLVSAYVLNALQILTNPQNYNEVVCLIVTSFLQMRKMAHGV